MPATSTLQQSLQQPATIAPARSKAAPTVPLGRSSTPEGILRELADLQCPAGVDPALFAGLKETLASMLDAKEASQLLSEAPDGPVNKVTDLAPLDAGASAIRLKWREANVGDYNLDGEVGVSDLTPIGIHFGKTKDASDWLQARVADGDHNGEVNVSDITPIGANFLHSVAGYRIYRQTAGEDEPQFLGAVPRDEALLVGDSSVLYVFADAVMDPQTVYTYTVAPYLSLDKSEGCKSVALAATCDCTYGLVEEGVPDTVEVEIDGVTMTALADHLLVQFNEPPTDQRLFEVAYDELQGVIWGQLTESTIYRVNVANSGRQSSQILGGKATSAAEDYEMRYDFVFPLHDPPIGGEGEDGDKGAAITYSDPKRGQQWGLDAVHADQAWDISEGDYYRVAVIDSGIDDEHPDLIARVDTLRSTTIPPGGYWWEDARGHGTHVAGIVAATAGNNTGIIGLANKCDIIAIKTGYMDDGEWYFNGSRIAEAIDYAVRQGTDVINLSLGFTYPEGSWPEYWYALSRAENAGVVVVASAGNASISAARHYPSDHPTVLSVAAVNIDLKRWNTWFGWFGGSNYGYPDHVDCAAPGADIWSTLPGNSYDKWSGTSMAAPHASALAALLLREDSSLTPAQVRSIIRDTGRSVYSDKPIGKLIDAYAALEYLDSAATSKISGKLTYEITSGEFGTAYWHHYVTLSPGNRRIDANVLGYYEFDNITNGTYTITPDPTSAFTPDPLATRTWDPLFRRVTVSGSDVSDVDFVARLDAPTTYTVTGTLYKGGGRATYHGLALEPGGHRDDSNSLGVFQFTGISNGTYTLTPDPLSGYYWSPVNRTVIVSGGNVTAADFTALPNPKYDADGFVVDRLGNGIYGVTVTVSPGGRTATTASNGYWAITDLADGSYTATPTRTQWTFSPSQRSFSISGADRRVDTFSGTAHFSASGRVTDAGGTARSGVTIQISGYASRQATTNSSGYWSVSDLEIGQYTASPSQSGWYFSPASSNFTLGTGSASDLDFTAYQNTYSASGYVRTPGGSGISGATMSFTGGLSPVTTGSSGYWQRSGIPNGSYSVAPSKSGLSFDPSSLGFTISNGPVTSLNFTGTTPPVADLDASPLSGPAPLTVNFDAGGSYDPDGGSIARYEWDWTNDGSYDLDSGSDATRSHEYESPGNYTARVRVTDDEDDQATDTIAISVSSAGAEWHVYTVDTTGNTGYHTSLAVVNGRPAIAYYNSTDADLRYVRAGNADGTAWGSPQVLDNDGGNSVGQWACLAVISGNPAITYQEKWPDYDLKYIRATDASGSSWGSAVVIDTNWSEQGMFTSLSALHGVELYRPAVAYYYGSNETKDLMYAYATDTTGASWHPPVVVDSSGVVGLYPSLTVVNGRPAISYYNATDKFLMYVRASTTSGSSWDTPVVPDSISARNPGYYTSLEMVNGRPAISYFAATNGALMYVRATDANGYLWGNPSTNPITLDPLGAAGSGTSLAIIGGKPAVAYFNEAADDLKYIAASDADGASWNSAETIESSGSTGWDPSLASVNGHPAVSYRDITGGDLKYAVYY